MDSSVCIGRAPSCGRRTARAANARAMKIAQRILSGGFAKHFDLDVVVQFVGRVAVAVKPDVTALDTFGINQFALVSFDVGLVFAGADGVVKNRRHIFGERWIVGALHHDVAIDAGLRVEMPDDDRVDIRLLFEVNLHPLLAWREFNPGTFVAFLVAVGDEVERANHGFAVAGGDLLALREVDGASGNHEIRALAFMRRFEIGHIDWHWGADEQRRGQLRLQRDFVVRERGGGGQQNGDGQPGNESVHTHLIQAWVSWGAISSVLRAAMASFALWMTYSLGNASSAGQFNFALPRMALKKFSRCGWWIFLLNEMGISYSASCAVSRTSTFVASVAAAGAVLVRR